VIRAFVGVGGAKSLKTFQMDRYATRSLFLNEFGQIAGPPRLIRSADSAVYIGVHRHAVENVLARGVMVCQIWHTRSKPLPWTRSTLASLFRR